MTLTGKAQTWRGKGRNIPRKRKKAIEDKYRKDKGRKGK
jgi:hypothetical protein